LCDVLRGVVSFGRLRHTTKLRAVRRCQSSPLPCTLLENACAARKKVVQSNVLQAKRALTSQQNDNESTRASIALQLPMALLLLGAAPRLHLVSQYPGS
jgi:hypothetical protein